MEQPMSQKQRRQELIQSLIDLGSQAYNPDADGISQAPARRKFDELVENTKTINLIPALNLLIRPGHVPAWLRTKLVEILARVPLRPDGVRGTMEFIFAVHPSSTVKVSEAAVPQRKGANITQEALRLAGQLISTPPSFVTAEDWFAGISGQLLDLLGEEGEPEVAKTAAYIIGFDILGRKSVGSPGTAGWKYFAEPMLDPICPPASDDDGAGAGADEIIDLSGDRVLVTSDELAKAIRLLRSLVLSHPNPGLCKRLLGPLLAPLWALSTWPSRSETLAAKYSTPAKELLNIYLKLAASPAIILYLIRNLSYTGGRDRNQPEWVYQDVDDNGIRVVSTRNRMSVDNDVAGAALLEGLDQKAPSLLDLVGLVCSDHDISAVFLTLFKRWTDLSKDNGKISINPSRESRDEEDPMVQVTEIKFLQGMMEKFPEKLASQVTDVLELVSQVLSGFREASGEDDSTAVALSLLNLVVTAPGFQKAKAKPEILQPIESSLERLSLSENDDISRTARNLTLLLRYRDELDDSSDAKTAPTDRQIEDRKTYKLAVSYIAQHDSPPPVKTEGLNLISGLVASHSPILDIPGILVLLSSLLSDDEDYINLKVIKIYTQLAARHSKSVTTELLDHYVDTKEVASVDTRLRFGEALLQVVERLGETFTQDVAQNVGQALLAVAGRRGHRPKMEAKQAREERLQKLKNKEAEEAWGGEVPDLSEDMTDEERTRNEILSRIVEGWGSKQGKEDLRIRASALSIFASAMETNIAGLGSALVSASVDLCIDILQLEREAEQGILRRSAVLLILSFVQALDAAKQRGQRLGFGLTAQEDVLRILRYIAETDNDGLVQQHARDVIESLENWQMSKLLPGAESHGTSLTKLAGLSVDPERSAPVSSAPRPKIEEIE